MPKTAILLRIKKKAFLLLLLKLKTDTLLTIF